MTRAEKGRDQGPVPFSLLAWTREAPHRQHARCIGLLFSRISQKANMLRNLLVLALAMPGAALFKGAVADNERYSTK